MQRTVVSSQLLRMLLHQGNNERLCCDRKVLGNKGSLLLTRTLVYCTLRVQKTGLQLSLLFGH